MNGCLTHYTENQLINYLKNKHFQENKLIKREVINSCEVCWKLWNKVRWDASVNTRGFLELREYLGEKFVNYYDSSWALANEWNSLNPKTQQEIFSYYKNTKNYLFNLVIWHESGDRPPVQNILLELIGKYKINSIADFGCGVGTDSLFLLENQKKVFMVDLVGYSTHFLEWRIQKRKLAPNAVFIDSEKMQKLPVCDMFWAIDVLEHLPNPELILDMLPEELKIFAHRSQFGDRAGGRHPSHMDFDENILKDGLLKRGFMELKPVFDVSVWVKKDLVV